MKLASLKDGRDGRLVVVSDDLAWCTEAQAIAPTLQAALDDWVHAGPKLKALAESLNHEAIPRERFHERACAAPLPRAYQWADGSAYVNHVALVRQARGAALPERFWTDPLLYQGGSDGFLGPRDPIALADESWGCDFEAEIAIVTDDVPAGVSAAEARGHIALIMLVNDVSLRNLVAAELEKGFGFFQSKPASAFSPVAVTPGALGGAWDGGKVSLPILVTRNEAAFGAPEAGKDMAFDFPALIAHAARTRALCAGTIIGGGTISNRGGDGGPGLPIAEGGAGYACIAEQRAVETLRFGAPRTPFLSYGEHIEIEMRDGKGRSIFGRIAQEIIRP
ncbi:MAG: fumarylacetoacetate hydrolase family protein [Hyphomonadaceae bacterium]